MGKVSLNLVLTAVMSFCLLSLNSCQVAQLVINGTTYYDAEITTKDNQIIAGQIGGQRSSNLPSGAKTISIKTADGRNKVKSEQIKFMKLSRKSHPEKQQVLVYTACRVPYTKKGVQKFREFKTWQILKSVGDNLLITAYGQTYSLSKDGTLVITYDRAVGIQYCLQRPGDETPILMGRNTAGRSYMRKQWLKYLADDPVLCEKIEKKEIDAFALDAIAEQYSPKR